MTSEEERREVAESIRYYAKESDKSAYDFVEGYWPNDLADLIDPTCTMCDAKWDNGECMWGCICSNCHAHLEHEHGENLRYCPRCGARVVSVDE